MDRPLPSAGLACEVRPHLATGLALAVSLSACSPDAYETCDGPGDCARVPEGAVVACVEKPGSGYCTWACETDDDCAWDGGEDAFGGRVCAGLESRGGDLFCLPSCEDDEDSCPYGMACRSTDDSGASREVCLPDESC